MVDEDVQINGTEDGVQINGTENGVQINEVGEDAESISRTIAYAIFYYDAFLQSSLIEAKNSYFEFKTLLEASESQLDEKQLSDLEVLRIDYEFQESNLHQRVLDFNENLQSRFVK